MDKRYYALLPALILIGVVSLFADKNEITKKKITRELIVPPVLKDLGKRYKVRIVYFVPSDREVKPNYQEKTEYEQLLLPLSFYIVMNHNEYMRGQLTASTAAHSTRE